MEAPKAYFMFNGSGLNMVFTNLSLNRPTTLLWAFGDGTTSTDESPSHSYSAEGYYNISLTATNAEGSSTFSIQTQIRAEGQPGYRPIYFMVSDALPTGVTASDTFITDSIRANQITMSLQLSPELTGDEIHNEAKYPPLANMLISKLTTIDILINGANKYLASLSTADSGDSSGAQVKKITTGPTDVEWFDGSKQWTEILKPGGTFQLIQQDACNLAARLMIQLPFCPQLPAPILPMTITPKRNIYVSPDNQFTK